MEVPHSDLNGIATDTYTAIIIRDYIDHHPNITPERTLEMAWYCDKLAVPYCMLCSDWHTNDEGHSI